MPSEMRKLLTAILLTVTLSAASQTKDRSFVFMPQSTAQAQFAGYYAALANGYYEEEGLDVTIVHPFSSQSNIDQLLQRKVDATMLPLAQAIESVSSGANLVNILQTSMNSAIMLISRNGTDPLSIQKGKVAVWNSGFDQLARIVTLGNNQEIEWVKTSNCVNLFISGAVDATLAMSFNEYYRLLQTGLLRSDQGVFNFREQGYNIQQDGVYMTRNAYQKNTWKAEAFARGSRKGWEWVEAHPAEALAIVMDYVKKNRIPTNKILQQLMLEEVLRLQIDPDSGKKEFRVREDMVEKANRLMMDAGMITREVNYKELMP